jgi:ATP-dependent exoDNAse (exonuclease V) beta subunit
VANLVMKDDGEIRLSVDKRHGFPAGAKNEKSRVLALARAVESIAGLKTALHAVRELPPARYSDEEWEIVRAGFTLLYLATGQLQVAFAEAGAADFIAVAQAALRVLRDEDGEPTDAALAIAEGIRHILVDEFQDTSRRQHELIRALVSAWPDQAVRTLFVVGDPKQSIYFFRAADAELFPRVQSLGIELRGGEALALDGARLTSNFRTAPELVAALNGIFAKVFAGDDSSGVRFVASEPFRPPTPGKRVPFHLHLSWVPESPRRNSAGNESAKRQAEDAREDARQLQVEEIVELIRGHQERIEEARARGDKYRVAVLGRARNSLAPIAAALREAAIRFRAVDLEPLAGLPEVRDVLALGRAILNPQDRLAWLGALRAPWCGLRLDELHQLAGADDPNLKKRTIPSLLRERASLLSAEGRAGVERVLHAVDEAARFRAAEPTARMGTWMEQAWLRLGGDKCVTAAQLVNTNVLWSCLDRIPGGEPGFLGPALDASLENLKAQPDPAAEEDCGVQLLTIHKAKGLEFEVVIVPDLHVRCAPTRQPMFSWLERGLAEPDDADEITEFLVAPFQTRGADKGKAKAWVDREYHQRERQENRRILYVAATRAREELHFFARPAYKMKDGAYELSEPKESLLETAWPALEREVRARFGEWTSSRKEAEVYAIAAGAESVAVMPKPAILFRLPADFQPQFISRTPGAQAEMVGAGATDLYRRHEGGLASRALGTAVHALLEELARLRMSCGPMEAATRLRAAVPGAAARARAAGLPFDQAETLASQALEIVLRASRDPIAAWILSPHPDSASEARWTGVIGNQLRTVQVDRVFRSGEAPGSDADNTWWIVDWKTAHADDPDAREALPRLRELFAPQLDLYGGVLRKLRGQDASICAGLYYPRMLQFDWWTI